MVGDILVSSTHHHHTSCYLSRVYPPLGTQQSSEVSPPLSLLHTHKMSSRPAARRLNVGVIGIGRMGRQHALNALHQVPRTNLVCVCSPAPQDHAWAEEHLVPHGVHVYHTVDEMLDAKVPSHGLEAVVIASTTVYHKDQVIQCVRRGLHVLCEKPLAVSVAEASEIAQELAVINSSKAAGAARPKLKVMTAFSRRFDDSYMNAVKAIRAGRIGTPVVVRSETRDMYDPSPFYRNYVMANPGIFIDTAVHDIDLTLAFLGAGGKGDEARIKPKSAHAIGNIAKHQGLDTIADVDNATGCVEWYPPEPGAVAPISYYFFSRIMPHGFDNPTEIIGTEGVLKVNLNPRRDLITVGDSNGLGNDVMPDFYERYEKAFVTEQRIFADCVLDDKELPYQLDAACKGMEIAAALQESLRTGKKIVWDEEGNRQSIGWLDGDTKSRL